MIDLMQNVELNPTCRFECLNCGRIALPSLQFKCTHCDGAVSCVYPNTDFSIDMRHNGIWRFSDILPILPHPFYDCEETPLIPISYGQYHLFGKNEGVLPSISTKYRQCAMSIPSLLALGCQEIAMVSSGNTGSSYMYWSNKVKGLIKTHVFASKLHANRLHFNNPYSQVHITEENLSDADLACIEFAKNSGIFYEGGFFNPFRREGLKTSYLESLLRLDWDVDVFIQAVSSGMGVIAFHSIIAYLLEKKYLKKVPKIVCVQQDTCCPMIKAYADGAAEIAESYVPSHPDGLAKAILRGNPKKSYPYVKKVVEQTKGCFCSVTQQEIRYAFDFLYDKHINACYTSATTFAAFKKLAQEHWIKPNDKCVIMLTGGLYEGNDH